MQIADVRLFLAVVAGGTLSAAARQQDINPMQASRRIAALEAELGVRLFHRTTRSLALTNEGEAFAPYAVTLVEADEGARGALRQSGAQASGVLRMTAPSVFGQEIVMPLLPALLERNPLLRIDLDVSDRVQDIVGAGLDLALRVATPGDSELVARRLAANPRVLCAAPRYLELHGVPTRLADLDAHACIGLHAVARWPFVVDGSVGRRRVDARIVTSSVDAARTAAVHGLGLVMLAYWDVHAQLRAGSLVRIELDDAGMEDLSVWAVTPTRRYVPERVKVFLAALEARLQQPVA